MATDSKVLWVVTYHYVRDYADTPYPNIKGLDVSSFHQQIEFLRGRCEMADLSSALSFLNGDYAPARDLCLLTFDDGLKEHYDLVLPALQERGLQAVFAIITGCADGTRVASAHKNHLLMATLPPEEYAERYRAMLDALGVVPVGEATPETVRATYQWDDEPTGRLKFLINFQTPTEARDQILGELFREAFGAEDEFARDLYVNPAELREMQGDGMVIAGHSHTHSALSTLGDAQDEELRTCASWLRKNCSEQELWPFVYPFGRSNSFDAQTVAAVEKNGFHCSFSTIEGANVPGQDLFQLLRVDTNEVSKQL